MTPATPLHPEEVLAQLRAFLPQGDITADGMWLRAHMRLLDPTQRSGWKLHLSATPAAYAALLDAALPPLAALDVPFKAAASTDDLEALNAGERGLTQVGKAITVYPRDEAHAAAIAATLHPALRGIPGPAVPTDFPYADDAPIHFRFGPYDNRVEIDALGQEHRLLWRPDLQQDIRDLPGAHDAAPPRAHLPHSAAPDHLAFLRERFRFLRMLHLSAKGGVFIAVENNATPPVPLLIKTARAHTNSDLHGRDAISALRREHALLTELRGLPGLPEPGELITAPAASAIVRPYLHGESFWDFWTRPDARTPEVHAQLEEALDQVRETLTLLHARGVIVRDLAPGNLLLSHDRAYFLDLELAFDTRTDQRPYRRGTRGFYDPARPRDVTPTPEDDHFALNVLAEMLHHGTPALLTATPAPPDDVTPATFRECAEALWQDSDPANESPDQWNAYSGAAGAVLCLPPAQAREAFAQDHARHDALARAAARVAHIPGLYFGVSGFAAALGILEGITPRALALLEDVDLDNATVPDQCQGLAGYIEACLTLHEDQPTPQLLALAQRAAARLRALATERDGLHLWPWPEGPHGDLAGAACFGFGHGAAGIVHALLRLNEHAPSPELEEEITRGLHTLCGAAYPVAPGDPALWYPVSPTDHTCWNAWCHGTPGVLITLARAQRKHAHLLPPDLLPRAARGLYTANNSELCLCHGVASRLHAATALLTLNDPALNQIIAPHARADADILARALRHPANAWPFTHPHENPHAWLTGRLGLATTLTDHNLLP